MQPMMETNRSQLGSNLDSDRSPSFINQRKVPLRTNARNATGAFGLRRASTSR